MKTKIKWQQKNIFTRFPIPNIFRRNFFDDVMFLICGHVNVKQSGTDAFGYSNRKYLIKVSYFIYKYVGIL